MSKKWDYLLSEFRCFGGVAENICQKEGSFGRGIFSINPKLRSRIYTPSKLMINKEDIFLEGNELRIKKDKNYNQEIRDFFGFYQQNFSWGGGGKETVKSFEKGLSEFTPNLKKLIKKHILIDLQQRHIGDWDKVILRQFLSARAFKFNNLPMICPILELVNHKVLSLEFIYDTNGISTPNYPPINGELFHNYNNSSSIKRFFNKGFFSNETIVFSFPFSIKLRNIGITFICKGQELKNDSMKIERSYDEIFIEGLPIADVNNPKLPNYYFDEICMRIGDIKSSKDLLSRIFKLNIESRKNMLSESNLTCNYVSNMFSKLLDYEIGLIPFDN